MVVSISENLMAVYRLVNTLLFFLLVYTASKTMPKNTSHTAVIYPIWLKILSGAFHALFYSFNFVCLIFSPRTLDFVMVFWLQEISESNRNYRWILFTPLMSRSIVVVFSLFLVLDACVSDLRSEVVRQTYEYSRFFHLKNTHVHRSVRAALPVLSIA